MDNHIEDENDEFAALAGTQYVKPPTLFERIQKAINSMNGEKETLRVVYLDDDSQD